MDILQAHRDITLAMDIMFINKVPFLVTISRALRFGTVELLENRQVPTIQTKLHTVTKLYRRRGFRIHNILADGEFAPLETIMSDIPFNLCGADEHVPEVERYIRTLKDRVRSCYNTLPYRYLPRLILARMVANAVFWLNSLPPRDGVSPTLSPRYLLTGQHLDFTKHVRLPFGAYAQVHEEHDNDMRPRTTGAICLGPTGNAQGTHFFLSLSSGRLLRRPHWTELPIPADVIARVSALGQDQGMPRTISFADRYGHDLPDGPHDVDDDHDSIFTDDPSLPDDGDDSVDGSSFASEPSEHHDPYPDNDQDPVARAEAPPPAGVDQNNDSDHEEIDISEGEEDSSYTSGDARENDRSGPDGHPRGGQYDVETDDDNDDDSQPDNEQDDVADHPLQLGNPHVASPTRPIQGPTRSSQ